MLTVRFGEATYELPSFDDALNDLTGEESACAEEFLGGWDNLRSPAHRTRQLILVVWLARRHHGETVTLEEIAATPGLIFGDVVDVDDDGKDEPEDPMVDPGRPLATPNESNGSTGGSGNSEATPATSETTGAPSSAASMG